MLQLNQHFLMKRGNERNAVLRDDREVVSPFFSPADSFVFLAFPPFTASVFEAVFLCPARVAQFILGQTNIRDYVPFLINRENVI